MAVWRNTGRSGSVTDSSDRVGGRNHVTAQVSSPICLSY